MHTYVGSGPYCYANSVAMMLGPAAPPPSVIEVLTGSPFGLELIAGRLPLFDPFGWYPDRGIDDALGLLGWSFRREGRRMTSRPWRCCATRSRRGRRWPGRSRWACCVTSPA